MDTPRIHSPKPSDLVRNSPFGIAVIDWDGVYVSVNDSYCRLYGYDAEDLIGHNFQQVFPPERRTEMLRLHQTFLRDGGSLNGLWEVQRHDGVIFSVLSESIRLQVSNDWQRLVYVMDVTELTHTRRQLQEREALLSDLTASMPGVVFRLERAACGEAHFLWCSARTEALLGITPERLCADVSQLFDRVVPGERNNQHRVLLRCLEQNLTWQQEFQILLPEGGSRWIGVHAEPRPLNGQAVWTGVMSDISGRRRMEEVLRTSEETFRSLFETVPQGIVYHDREGRITSANPAALRILGLSFAQLLGRVRIDPLSPAIQEDGQPFAADQQPARQALATSQPVRDVVMGIRTARGREAWIRVNAIPMMRHGQLTGVYTSFEDITRSLELAQELRRQAATDHLTGLANRRAFITRLEQEYERVQRHTDVPATVILIDLDLFKQVNDTWGHAAGDAVLQEISKRMALQVRRLDLLGRYGGEEFALLMPHTALPEACQLAERLRLAIAAQPVRFQGHAITITASLGLGAIDPADEDAYAALARADGALYAAKEAGRNRIAVSGDPDGV